MIWENWPKKTSGIEIAAKKIIKEYRNVARKKRYWRRDKRVEEDVAFVKQVPVHPKDKLARKVRDQFKDLGTVDYNNDTNIGDLGTKKIPRTLVAGKKIVKKYRNLARKKPYQWPHKKVEESLLFVKQLPVHPKDRLAREVRDQFDDLETADYSNDTNISDLGTKETSGTQIAAKKLLKNTKIWQGKNHAEGLIRE